MNQDVKKDDPKKLAEDAKKRALLTTRAHFYGTAMVTETGGNTQPLANGIVLTTGKIIIAPYKSDESYPIAAWFIPADESAMYPGTGTVTGPDGDGMYNWMFTWDDVPAFGCDGILRFADLLPPPGGYGTTTDFSVSVVEQPGKNPCGDDGAGP